MEWNVYRHDFNSQKIEVVDVFDHSSFSKEVLILLKKSLAREVFAKELKSAVMRYFWSKCEHEVVITSFPPHIDKKELDRLNGEFVQFDSKWGHYPYRTDVRLDVASKIDIYDQIMLNWERFVDYVFGFRG